MSPNRAALPCNATPTCPYTRPCPVHGSTTPAQRDRPSARASLKSGGLGYGRKWDAARGRFLKEFPLCSRCLAAGLTVQADVVDHQEPHHGDPVIFWQREMWRPLDKRCHSLKTRLESKPNSDELAAFKADEDEGMAKLKAMRPKWEPMVG